MGTAGSCFIVKLGVQLTECRNNDRNWHLSQAKQAFGCQGRVSHAPTVPRRLVEVVDAHARLEFAQPQGTVFLGPDHMHF
jgi:hypothetical protein